MARFLLTALFTTTIVASAFGHGSLIWPPQRGVTNGFKFADVKVKISGDKTDWLAHFPAGDKATWPGAAMKSQRDAAGPAGWVPYDPFKWDFKWRAGVCGDTVWGNDHMRGGKYYNDGKVHATYDQGGTISIDMAIIAHHNGYVELFVCDVAKCGGEISKKCFQQGSCHKLKREWDGGCESRNDWHCPPIDPNHPTRWYLPCGKSYKPGQGVDVFGKGKAKFKLPENLSCEHCVLQWYWVAANSCNPPGVYEFFRGSRKPNWHNCPGQGEAKGGSIPWKNPCGGQRAPEEYYTCADIKIKPKWGSAQNNWRGARTSNKRGRAPSGSNASKSSRRSSNDRKSKSRKNSKSKNKSKNNQKKRNRNSTRRNWNNRPSNKRSSRRSSQRHQMERKSW